MDLSQLSDKLQSVEKVIQFTQEKTKTKTGAYPIYPTTPLGQDMTQGQFLSGV